MMPNLNVIHLIGHVGREVETRAVGDSLVDEFTMAVSRGRNKKTGEEYGTDWFRIQSWNTKFVQDIIHKGDLVYVQGRMEIDRKNEKIYTNVRAFKILKLREPKRNTQTYEVQDNEVIDAAAEEDQPPF